MAVDKLEAGKWYFLNGKRMYCSSLFETCSSHGYFTSVVGGCSEDIGSNKEVYHFCHNSEKLESILSGHSKKKLSKALGHHHSYLSKILKTDLSDSIFEDLKNRLTIDWSSKIPYSVNDGIHVPYIIKPSSCVTDKHKNWFAGVFYSGAVKL